MEDKIEDKAESIKEKAIEEELKPQIELTREEKEIAAKLEQWNPRTKLGKLVRDRKITDIKEVVGKYKILESEVIDTLIKINSDIKDVKFQGLRPCSQKKPGLLLGFAFRRKF